jgi:hypothetical protein
MKKSLIGLALAAGVGLVASPASAIVVSGIDFGTLGAGNVHLETETLAEQFINPATTAPGTGTGLGYGFVTSVNGNTNYCTAGGGCGLYYIVNFTGGTFNGTGTQITFTGTDVNIYYLNGPTLNLFSQNSPGNLGLILGGTLYASMSGHGNLGGGQPANVVSVADGTLTGGTLTLTGSGLLDINTLFGNAAFASFLNGNGVPDSAGGFADVAYTESVRRLGRTCERLLQRVGCHGRMVLARNVEHAGRCECPGARHNGPPRTRVVWCWFPASRPSSLIARLLRSCNTERGAEGAPFSLCLSVRRSRRPISAVHDEVCSATAQAVVAPARRTSP